MEIEDVRLQKGYKGYVVKFYNLDFHAEKIFSTNNLVDKLGEYQKFVYFQRFDEFFPQFQFLRSNRKFVLTSFFIVFRISGKKRGIWKSRIILSKYQKFVYFQRFDEFFLSISIFPLKSKVCLFSAF